LKRTFTRFIAGSFAPLVAMAALVTASAAQADAVTETAHVVITGGPHAGTYDASSDRAGCSAGMTGPGSFGNQLSSRDKDPKKFNSLQLIVDDAKKAAAGSKEFYISFGFGPLVARSAEYIIETRPQEKKKAGSGVVTVEDKGTTGKVTFAVVSKEGYKFEGSIDCKSVIRNPQG